MRCSYILYMPSYDMDGNVIPANPQRSARMVRTVSKRRGESITILDAARSALPPGLRISKNGKRYFESRTNRSDNSSGV